MRLDQSSAADDFHRAGRVSRRAVRPASASARSWRPRSPRDDPHLVESLLDVARHRHHQQEKYRRCASSTRTAPRAHPRKSRLARTGGRIRKGTRTQENFDAETGRYCEEQGLKMFSLWLRASVVRFSITIALQ